MDKNGGKYIAQGGEGQDKAKIAPGQDGQPEEEEAGQKDNADNNGGIGENPQAHLEKGRGGAGGDRADFLHAVGQEHVSQRYQDYRNSQDR